MVKISKVVLDVLKPHEPSILEVSSAIAKLGETYCAHVTVVELDRKTETLRIEITGSALDMSLISTTLSQMGASLHSVDEVIAVNGTA